MELIALLIYSFFVWLIFFKFKWLPWNITTQVITITIPVFALAIVILLLNVGAPSTADVRALNYVVQVVPRVTGRVIEVPVEPNQPVKKGDVLFKIDPVPFELEVKAAQANVNSLRAKLLTARGNELTYGEQLKGATGKKAATAAKLDLARLRVAQYKELSKTGAGNRFDLEQAEADVSNLSNELTSLVASESQAKAKLGAKTKEGEQDEVAQARALIAQAEAQLDDAKWKLSQTVYYAPANGTIINLQLRVGAVASQLVANPVMTFVEDEQWLLAIYSQNEVRRVKPGDEAEIALRMYPGRVLKCKVDSVVWATAQGQLPISGNLPNVPPMPEGRLAVKLMLDGKDQNTFMAAGARGQGAIYTDYVELLHVIRRVFLRVSTKLDWLILKLH
jgi:multidrug resistance efflux pump